MWADILFWLCSALPPMFGTVSLNLQFFKTTSLNIMIVKGVHNLNKPEITARVSKIDIYPGWTGDWDNDLKKIPDAAVSVMSHTPPEWAFKQWD